MRVRALERGERARVGPALEVAPFVPRVDRRIHGARVPLEQRDEPRLQVAVEALDRGVHLAAPELLRGPERVVPEVARELAERSGVGRSWCRGRLQLRSCVLDAELVVEDAISATEHARCRREQLAPLGGDHQREVDVLTVLVEDAALDALADRGRLEEGENRRAELTDPVLVVDESRRLVDEQDRVEVRPAIGRRVGARLRPDDEHRAHVLALARPVGDGRSEKVHPRVDVERAASRRPPAPPGSRLAARARRARRETPAREASPSCTRPEAVQSAGSRALRASSRRSSGVTSGVSTGRTTHVSCVAARRPAITPNTAARSSVPSSRTGNGSCPSSAFPTATTSSHTSLRIRHARSPSVSPRNDASAFGEPNRSDAPPTRSTPVAATRSATAPSRPSPGRRAPSRRA